MVASRSRRWLGNSGPGVAVREWLNSLQCLLESRERPAIAAHIPRLENPLGDISFFWLTLTSCLELMILCYGKGYG